MARFKPLGQSSAVGHFQNPERQMPASADGGAGNQGSSQKSWRAADGVVRRCCDDLSRINARHWCFVSAGRYGEFGQLGEPSAQARCVQAEHAALFGNRVKAVVLAVMRKAQPLAQNQYRSQQDTL